MSLWINLKGSILDMQRRGKEKWVCSATGLMYVYLKKEKEGLFISNWSKLGAEYR